MKGTSMFRVLLPTLLLTMAACGPTPAAAPSRKARLITSCSSSAECAHESNGCTYCYHGQCSCTLPAEPIP
jgi:hypothetical protein